MITFVCAAVNDGRVVLAAVFITAAIVLSVMVYAMTTKTDFTFCGAFLFIFLALLIMFPIMGFAFGFNDNLVFCTFGVVLYGVYLVIDT